MATGTNRMRITVIGAGAWGTALARLLKQGNHDITLWGHVPEWLEEIRQTGRNERFLPGIELPPGLGLESRPAPRPGRGRMRGGGGTVPALPRSHPAAGQLHGSHGQRH